MSRITIDKKIIDYSVAPSGSEAGGRESEIHPMYDLLANAAFVDRVKTTHWNVSGEELGIMHFVYGERAPFEAALEDIDSVLEYELTQVDEDSFYAYLRSELPSLEALLEKVANVHGTDAPWIVSVKEVFADLKPSMEAHIQKEEEIVFPFIRSCTEEGTTPEPDALDGDPIALMEEEHDETGAALKRMRTLSHDFTLPEWGCNSFRAALDGLKQLEADTHQHVHKENSILFPRARALV
jgi:iron-sulfur cluster repair di-iron protein